MIGADGKTYGVLHWMANQVLVYNKRMLADAGLQVAMNPEDLYRTGLKVTTAPNQYDFAIVDQAVTQLYEELVKFVAGWGTHFSVDDRRPDGEAAVVQGVLWLSVARGTPLGSGARGSP